MKHTQHRACKKDDGAKHKGRHQRSEEGVRANGEKVLEEMCLYKQTNKQNKQINNSGNNNQWKNEVGTYQSMAAMPSVRTHLA